MPKIKKEEVYVMRFVHILSCILTFRWLLSELYYKIGVAADIS